MGVKLFSRPENLKDNEALTLSTIYCSHYLTQFNNNSYRTLTLVLKDVQIKRL